MGHAIFLHRRVIRNPMALVPARLFHFADASLASCWLLMLSRCASRIDMPLSPTPGSPFGPWQLKPYSGREPVSRLLGTRKWCGEKKVPKWKSRALESLPALLAFADWLSRREGGRVWIQWDSWNVPQRPNLQSDFPSTFFLGHRPSMCMAATPGTDKRQRREDVLRWNVSMLCLSSRCLMNTL